MNFQARARGGKNCEIKSLRFSMFGEPFQEELEKFRDLKHCPYLMQLSINLIKNQDSEQKQESSVPESSTSVASAPIHSTSISRDTSEDRSNRPFDSSRSSRYQSERDQGRRDDHGKPSKFVSKETSEDRSSRPFDSSRSSRYQSERDQGRKDDHGKPSKFVSKETSEDRSSRPFDSSRSSRFQSERDQGRRCDYGKPSQFGSRDGGRGDDRSARFQQERPRAKFGRQEDDRGERLEDPIEPETCEIIKPCHVPIGTSGRKTDLITNFFRIKIDYDNDRRMIYQYHLAFSFRNKQDKTQDKSLDKFFVRNASHLFEDFLKLNLNHFKLSFVYDFNTILFCQNLLPIDELNKIFISRIGDRDIEFELDIKMVQTLDLTIIQAYYEEKVSSVPEHYIQFFELFFKNIYSKKYTFYRQKFYDLDNLFRTKKSWVQFAHGFKNGVRLTEIGPALSLHLKSTALISNDVVSLQQLCCAIVNCTNSTALSEKDLQQINRVVNGLKIFTTHSGTHRKYLMKSLISKRPNECFFTTRNDQGVDEEITVKEYFRHKYKIDLQPNPLVVALCKRTQYIPLEFCYVLDKQFLCEEKIDANIFNELLRFSTHKPMIYLNKITKFANDINRLESKMIDDFKISFVPRPIKLTGRVIDRPTSLSEKFTDKFYQTTPSPKWAFFSFDRYFGPREVDRMVQDLKQTSFKFGLRLDNCLAKETVTITNHESIINCFANINYKLPGIQLLFCAIPAGDTHLYNIIKHVGDQRFHIITQCINTEKAKSRNRGYIENLLLKVNGKLGGIVSIVHEDMWRQFSIDVKKTMIVGIDVSHPSAGVSSIESSIACACGSYDHCYGKYIASIRAQKKDRDENIDRLDEIIEELLVYYRQKNGYFPDNMIVYRDGISHGQFNYAENEIKMIHDAFHRNNRNGKIVYIVMQKNHQARFVLANPDPGQNQPLYIIPQGTIVDNTITDPAYHMFYMNSHHSPLGTSRPMKYIVLQNDFDPSQFNNDQLQRFCYYCCHNCTRFRKGPIAMPVPLRYADLCAYRSKVHLEAQKKITKEVDKENVERLMIVKLNELIKVDERVRELLYYV
ncbi:argonaute-2-like protein [Sarcoptes scabiei]|uniref:Argonaute-2-like protein n=1 Tax=Sarcoptes scabiei TaxID=52283 RepID=A0A131ZZS3_SARSC|nr:argonaute-2-like protein [Sarcoptes scabiei]